MHKWSAQSVVKLLVRESGLFQGGAEVMDFLRIHAVLKTLRILAMTISTSQSIFGRISPV